MILSLMLNDDVFGSHIFHLIINIILQVVAFSRNMFMLENNKNILNPI